MTSVGEGFEKIDASPFTEQQRPSQCLPVRWLDLLLIIGI